MFGIRAVFLLSLVINVLVNGYQEDRNVDGELEVLLKRLQERLEDEERGSELQNFERIFRGNLFGVEVEADPEVTQLCTAMKWGESYKWATLKIEGNKVVVDKTADQRGIEDEEDQFNKMKSTLPSEPRYVLFYFHFNSKTGRVIEKMALILWFDQQSSKLDRAPYTTTKDNVRKACPAFKLELNPTSVGDLNYEEFRAEIESRFG
ncbi:uncharacterized protein [Asterias amurensis]|uniref:uncharacterized protein n=1 Tax=Asterias amurensis TaxID=7602 RepID=UPI003AB116C8